MIIIHSRPVLSTYLSSLDWFHTQVSLHLLGLANKYDFAPLQQALMSYLKATLSVTNVCVIYNVASYYQLKELVSSCSTFIDTNATEVMNSDGFLSLTQTSLTELIARDSFFAPEMVVYGGVLHWLEHNAVKRDEAKDLLKGVRLQLISRSDLFEIRKSSMFDPDDILDAIEKQDHTPSIELKQRGLLRECSVF